MDGYRREYEKVIVIEERLCENLSGKRSKLIVYNNPCRRFIHPTLQCCLDLDERDRMGLLIVCSETETEYISITLCVQILLNFTVIFKSCAFFYSGCGQVVNGAKQTQKNDHERMLSEIIVMRMKGRSN